MPLKSGSDKETISENIHELTHNGSRPRSHAQIVAIALHNADKSKKEEEGRKKSSREKASGNKAEATQEGY